MPESFWRSVQELADRPGPALHMPGHGNACPVDQIGGAQALPPELMRLDQSEIGGLDYLHDPQGPLAAAQRRAARLFGAAASWFLVNGATVGNLAAVWAVARPGGRIVMMRRSHQSTHTAAALAGLQVDYLAALAHEPLDGLFGFALEQLAAALTRQPDVVAVHVTSPDYYGYRLPLEDIAALCHRHGVPLIVDEAHGAHLYFLPGQPTALAAGADLVIHSPHKSLGSLTQSALLHARGPLVDQDRVAEALVLLQSSSPSSLLTMSLDAVLEDLQHSGAAVWSERAAWAGEVRARRVDGRPLFVDHAAFPRGTSAADPCKLLVSQPAWVDRLTELRAALLSGYGIRPEFSDHRTLVFSVVRGTTRADLDTLATALTELLAAFPGTGRPGTTVDRWPADSPVQGCAPRLAMQAPRQVVPLDDAAGRIAARAVTPYPPGIPLLLPGELISPATLDLLRRLLAGGAVVRGLVTNDCDTGLFCLESPWDPPTVDPTNTGAPQMTQVDR